MSDAYRRAYNPQRAKTKTIHEKASRIMARGKVQARVAELMAPVIAAVQMSRKEWLERVTHCCRFDPRKMFDTLGRPKKLTELDDTEAAAIGGFEFYENFQGKGESRKPVGYTKKFKLTDRLRALELYGKACSYYAERRELTGPDGQPLQPLTGIKVEFVDASLAR